MSGTKTDIREVFEACDAVYAGPHKEALKALVLYTLAYREPAILTALGVGEKENPPLFTRVLTAWRNDRDVKEAYDTVIKTMIE